MDPSISQATLDAVRAALLAPVSGNMLAKASETTQGITTTTGMYGYNLEAPAKTLVPILTPLRNRTPRKGGGHGTAVEWKAVTNVNATNLRPGVAEGSKGTVPSITFQTYSAGYRTLGFPGEVTMQAIWASQEFDDALNRGTVTTLQTTMLGEEQTILGGNKTAIGKPSTLTFADTALATDGTLTPDATAYFGVSALTLQGKISGSTGIVSVVDAADETDVCTGNHAATTYDLGSTATIVHWPAVRGAVAYNVYVGTTSTLYYRATVTANTYELLTTPSDTGHLPNAADQTADDTVFDGIIPQLEVAGSGAYFVDMAGTALTSDNAGGVVQIDTMLKSLWDNARLSPSRLLVNSQEALTITQAVLTAGSTGAIRVMASPAPGGTGLLQAGFFVATYLNKFCPSQPVVQIEVHPNMPAGKIVAIVEALPAWYPNSNVSSVFELDVRQEYVQYDFAFTALQREFGVYVDEVLKCYLPAGCGVITGIAAS
jgi:hypothetical protein